MLNATPTKPSSQSMPAVPLAMKKAQQNVAGKMGANPGAHPQPGTMATNTMGAGAKAGGNPPPKTTKPKLQKPKKKFPIKYILAGLVLVLLLVGAGAGYLLTQTSQDVRQQASITPVVDPGYGDDGIHETLVPDDSCGGSTYGTCLSGTCQQVAPGFYGCVTDSSGVVDDPLDVGTSEEECRAALGSDYTKEKLDCNKQAGYEWHDGACNCLAITTNNNTVITQEEQCKENLGPDYTKEKLECNKQAGYEWSDEECNCINVAATINDFESDACYSCREAISSLASVDANLCDCNNVCGGYTPGCNYDNRTQEEIAQDECMETCVAEPNKGVDDCIVKCGVTTNVTTTNTTTGDTTIYDDTAADACVGTTCVATGDQCVAIHRCDSFDEKGECIELSPEVRTGSVDAQAIANESCQCVQIDLLSGDSNSCVYGHIMGDWSTFLGAVNVCPDDTAVCDEVVTTTGDDGGTGGDSGGDGDDDPDPTLAPSPTPTIGCNDSCVVSDDCNNADHICYDDGTGSTCRHIDNPNSESCMPLANCNEYCQEHTDCVEDDHYCYAETSTCRLISYPTSLTCTEPAASPSPTPTPTVGCNDACATDSDCSNTDHICNSSTQTCRLEENPGDENCAPAEASPTPSPTPTPAPGCNEECYSNSDCTNSSPVCYDNLCRLSSNPTNIYCQESTKDVTTTTTSYYTQPDAPETLPESGADDIFNWLKVGLGVLGLGLIFLFL